MFATLLTLALVAAPALRSVAAFSMSTPDLTQCGSAHVTWDETEGPYNLVVVNSSAPCGDILADLGDHTSTSITWKVDFPAGSTLMFSLEDKNGDEAWSAPMTVAESSDVSCLDNAAAASSSAAAGSVGSSSADPYLPTETVQAAGAAVTDGSSTDDGSGTIIGGASEGTSAGFVVRVNPVMALCAVFAVALTL